MESAKNELSHSALEAKLKFSFLFSAGENYSDANRLNILLQLAALSLVSVLLFSGPSRLVFFFFFIQLEGSLSALSILTILFDKTQTNTRNKAILYFSTNHHTF